MYQVSEALDKVISGSGRTFYARLNGISDGIQEIVQTNFSTPDSYFYVGGAIASKIEVSMFTKSQKFVKGTEVRFEIGAIADGTIEWIPMGYFTIKEQKKDRNLLTFTAYDRLESKLAKAYKSKIVKYPVESKEFLTDISEQTGVEFDTSKLSDSLMIDKILTVNDQSGEKTYKEPFDGFTMQQVVGYIAQLHGTFAICDRNGKVTFKWYEALTIDHPGKIGDTAGSYLKDQNLSFIYNTIEFLKESHTYLIKTNRYFDDLLQSETMCQISGISCDTENNHYESGTNINTNLSNPVMTQEWLNKILKKIKDMSYYPVSFSFMGDPRLDVGDVVTIVDAKNNLIDVPVMQHTITFDGGLLSEVSSYGFEEKEVKSPSEIALQRIKDDILSLQEITAKKATFNQLNAVDAKITNLQASTITVNDANILFARLDKANIQQGWITNVMIGDAQITNAKIQGMSADKLTAGTIDASIITVKNLDADSITVGKINWKQLSDDVNTTITDSKNTANNALNAANSSVQNVIIEYYSSTSKDQPVNGMWQTDSPDWVEGRYVWCRTKTVTKSGVISYSDASCITGNTGAQGDRGIPGINGENGQTSYLHIAYANSADGTSGFSTNDSTNKLYIGQYIDFIEADSTLPSAYQWTKIKGDTGAKGEDGVSPIASVTKSGNVTTITITDKNGTHTQKVTDGTNGTPGASGADGRTSYFHAKYSNDGGKTFTANNGEATGDWIGTYTDFTEADSMSVVAYTWVKIKGDKGDQGVQGKGIKSIKGQYYLSSSKISLVGGTWSDTQPTWTEGSYIWTRSYIIWSDDTITTTTPILANALNTANSVANTALSTADGKNTVFYQPNQPSATGRKTNDVWYDTGNENAMYYFDGKSWVKKVFGNNALDNISASKITTGILDAEKVTLINLDAGSITTGTITGLDAIFNRSFTVNSPYSDTQSFIIEANQNNIIIGTRIKDVLYSTNDNSIIFSPTGVTLQGGNGAVVITAKHDVTIGSDGGSIYLNANGTTYNDIPIYARNDLYTFKILHEGNTTLKSEFSSGVEIGSISLGTLSMTLKVPLASTTQSGLITASEKSKLNTDYLPLTGGTLESSNVNVLGLNCTSGMMSTLRFYGSGKRLGSVGFNAQNSSLYRWNTSGTAYRILDENDLPLMTDSGWVNITLGSGITAVSYIGARVRKIGNIVNVVMGITGATAAFQTLGTLAQGYRPSKEINLAARYYNSPTTAIAIGTDGAIKLLQTASGGSSYNASGAISFSITYFI